MKKIEELKKEFKSNKDNAELYDNAGGMTYLANELRRQNSKILKEIKSEMIRAGKITGRTDQHDIVIIENEIVYQFAIL